MELGFHYELAFQPQFRPESEPLAMAPKLFLP